MTTRKITLLAVFAFLLAVCIIQGITGAINPVKTIKTDAEPDAITITKDGKTVELTKNGFGWQVGSENYIANKSDVEKMIKEIQEIKILDKIARLGNAENDEKYNLSESRATFVRAFKDGKEIQSLMLGKTSPTGSQTYGSVSGKKDIFLFSGNLISTFDKTEESLRSKTVYSIEENMITGANVEMGAQNWTLTKEPGKSAKNSDAWKISGTSDFEVDSNEAKKWIQNVAFMNISSWIDDGTALPKEKLVSFKLFTTSETVSVEIYEQKNGDETKYYGTCSRTPHKFELTKTQTEKFTKNPETLKAKTE